MKSQLVCSHFSNQLHYVRINTFTSFFAYDHAKKSHPLFTSSCLLILFLLLSYSHNVGAQEFIDLYPGAVPNSKVETENVPISTETQGLIREVIRPTIQVFKPAAGEATGTAMLIIPGGGYAVIVYAGEGINSAKALAEKGITTFVLKYRLPKDELQNDKSIAPLQDAQQAMKVIRERAEEFGIDPNKIGVMGFSAGGHLASMLATHYEPALIDNPDGTSLRPDFQIVVYPVISFLDSITHKDSRTALLGENFTEKEMINFSNELQVTSDTPPAYITHAGDDGLVPVDNSLNYYRQLIQHKVPAEMHLYPKGNHGFLLRWPIDEWRSPLLRWMNQAGF